MPDTINLFGTQIPKKAAIYGGIAAVGIGGIYYYRQRQNASAAAAATANAGANTGIDSATGYAYGSPEDAAALANQGDYQQPYNAGNFASGQVIGYNSNGDPIYGAGGGNINSGQGGGPGSFVDNAQWAQYVENYLESVEQADPVTVGNAIGKYISGQPLTDAMIQIVENAIAIGGKPPIAGQNGNPPSYITATSTPATPPPAAATTVKVPYVVGKNLAQAISQIENAGLKEHTTTAAAYGNPSNWIVAGQNPAGGSIAIGSTITVSAKHK